MQLLLLNVKKSLVQRLSIILLWISYLHLLECQGKDYEMYNYVLCE